MPLNISQFPASTNPPNTTDLLPIMQGGRMRQTTLGALFTQLLSFVQSGTGAGPTDLQTRGRNWVLVTDFYANGSSGALVDPTGVTDSTTGIQNAINSFGSGSGTVIFPPGTYKVTSGLTILKNRVWLIGEGGENSATIDFQPTATATCFQFGDGSFEITQCGVQGIGFKSGNSNTQVKTAISGLDFDTLTIRQVAVGTWGGTGSIGLQTKGRQRLLVKGLTINCDIPIRFSQNVNSAAHTLGLDTDHFHLEDLYLIANNNPVLTFDDGVCKTNMTFDGQQSWVGGTHGLYQADATAPISSYKLAIKNVRREQSTSATAHNIHIENTGTQTLQDLLIENCYFDPNQDGYYLRKCEKVELNHNTYAGGSGRTAMDITGISETELVTINCRYAPSATFTRTSLNQLWGPTPLSASREPETSIWSFASGGINTTSVDTNSTTSLTLKVNGTAALTLANGGAGTLAGNLTLGSTGSDSTSKMLIKGTAMGLRLGMGPANSSIDGVDNTNSSYQPLSITASVLNLGIAGVTKIVLDANGNAKFVGVVAVGNVAVSTTTNLLTPAGTTGLSSLRIPHGAAPTSPVDGDMWSTTTTLNFRLNGVTKSITMT